MTTTPSSATPSSAPQLSNTMLAPSPACLYRHSVDPDAMASVFEQLVSEVTSALSTDALAGALDAGIDSMSAILRAIPILEGKLLERGISLIATINPDLVVLTDNLRLPVTPAAMQLVEKNAVHLYRSLTLDADSGGRKSYTPDLLILNRPTRIAHVIDVKRSLSSYEVSRIAALKSRMLAAALVVPDLLYKEHRRLVAEDVRVVIVNAESQRTDIDGGIWPLGHLDHLLEINGAGAAMTRLRELFRDKITANWTEARQLHSGPDLRSGGGGQGAATADETNERTSLAALGPANDDDPAKTAGHATMPRIGFAKVPGSGLR
ncbi:hypothetical protein IFT59_21830 [Rhizobium sp. CFBP 8752]|uniref:hypothetical protein n=1 Tax=Rhizobium sp. CFBP 8752 TaxID=2775301 RepID=UPI00177B742C|nr:hypothetical protein [Rhizobium sp. CFBP 8752]MBD8665888.1 hypothetical protein [Rhizobium sp. CFBP 8752]